jgi:pyruvate carboxylase
LTSLKLTTGSFIAVVEQIRPKADLKDPSEIGASMRGNVVKVKVQKGDAVVEGDVLLTLSAMKMVSYLLH